MINLNRQAQSYVDQDKDVANFNLQAWVPISHVANILYMIETETCKISSLSDLMRYMVDSLNDQARAKGYEFPSLEEAITWLEDNKFRISQIRKSGVKKLGMGVRVAELKQKAMGNKVRPIPPSVQEVEESREDTLRAMLAEGKVTKEQFDEWIKNDIDDTAIEGQYDDAKDKANIENMKATLARPIVKISQKDDTHVDGSA
jgi:hypothetical protein